MLIIIVIIVVNITLQFGASIEHSSEILQQQQQQQLRPTCCIEDMLTSQEFRRTATDRKFTNILRSRTLPQHDVRRVRATDLKASLLVKEGLLEQPLLITDSPESIGMKVPAPNTTLEDIADIVGPDTQIKLIEVGKQAEISGHTIGEYAQYFMKRSADHKTLNLISLEFSATPLATRVQSPRVVREIDWIDLVWPLDRRARGDYPKVQKYCLAGNHHSLPFSSA